MQIFSEEERRHQKKVHVVLTYKNFAAHAGISHIGLAVAALFNGNGPLRIGAFGATRPQKNLMSAAGAALQLHEELKVTRNCGSHRDEQRAAETLSSIRSER